MQDLCHAYVDWLLACRLEQNPIFCDSSQYFLPPRGALGGISSPIFAGCTMATRNATSFTMQAMRYADNTTTLNCLSERGHTTSHFSWLLAWLLSAGTPRCPVSWDSQASCAHDITHTSHPYFTPTLHTYTSHPHSHTLTL